MVEVPFVRDEPGQLEFVAPVSWFVYIGDGRHRWRFVHRCAEAYDGEKAIEDAMRATIEMGNDPNNLTYMAVPTPAAYTLAVGSPSVEPPEGPDRADDNEKREAT